MPFCLLVLLLTSYRSQIANFTNCNIYILVAIALYLNCWMIFIPLAYNVYREYIVFVFSVIVCVCLFVCV